MKKQRLLLTNPCTENWDEMPPSKQGRYCANCEKHIVDLTTKSDAELIAFFKTKKNNVCGRLLSTQLHRDIILPTQRTHWHWLIPFVIGASVIAPNYVKAQKTTTVQDDLTGSSSTKYYLAKLPDNQIIKGKVIGKEGNPLIGVKITRKGFRNVIAQTDSAGHFSLNLSIDARVHPLVFELAGYRIIEKNISTNMIVILPDAPRIMLGGIRTINVSNRPLYVVNAGKETCSLGEDKDLHDIKVEWIEKIDVLKGASATATYGSKAANGVIVIKLKEQYFDKVDFLKKN